MKRKHLWTLRTLGIFLILFCGFHTLLIIHITLADPLGIRITDLQHDLGQAETAINNAEAKLGASHDLMDELNRDWSNLSEENRDKAVDAIISLLSLDWSSLVKQGAKIGITFDSGSSLTSNFDLAVSRTETLIMEMNAACIRYYTTLAILRPMIIEHNSAHKDRGISPEERHTVPKGPVEPWFIDEDLPDIPCHGGCGTTFSSPSAAKNDHNTPCGEGENIDDEARRCRHEPRFQGQNHEAIVDIILSERSVIEGCGRDYYWCTQSEEHTIHFCTISIGDDTCGDGFRRCMPHSTEHGPGTVKTSHDDDPTRTTTSQQVVPSHGTIPVSSGSTDITYTCGVHSGSPIDASNHEWGTAPCGDATHVGYLCQIIASDHEWIYESCPSGHAHYECDYSNHSLQASCSETNANGDTCTVTNFYACETHTHQY